MLSSLLILLSKSEAPQGCLMSDAEWYRCGIMGGCCQMQYDCVFGAQCAKTAAKAVISKVKIIHASTRKDDDTTDTPASKSDDDDPADPTPIYSEENDYINHAGAEKGNSYWVKLLQTRVMPFYYTPAPTKIPTASPTLATPAPTHGANQFLCSMQFSCKDCLSQENPNFNEQSIGKAPICEWCNGDCQTIALNSEGDELYSSRCLHSTVQHDSINEYKLNTDVCPTPPSVAPSPAPTKAPSAPPTVSPTFATPAPTASPTKYIPQKKPVPLLPPPTSAPTKKKPKNFYDSLVHGEFVKQVMKTLLKTKKERKEWKDHFLRYETIYVSLNPNKKSDDKSTLIRDSVSCFHDSEELAILRKQVSHLSYGFESPLKLVRQENIEFHTLMSLLDGWVPHLPTPGPTLNLPVIYGKFVMKTLRKPSVQDAIRTQGLDPRSPLTSFQQLMKIWGQKFRTPRSQWGKDILYQDSALLFDSSKKFRILKLKHGQLKYQLDASYNQVFAENVELNTLKALIENTFPRPQE